MKTYAQAAALLLITVALAWPLSPASAQPTPPKLPTGLEIAYAPPSNPVHQPIYERVKTRGVLEKYKEFMAPLKLPRGITIATEGCNGKINAWYANAKITYCYEYMAFMEEVARHESTQARMSPHEELRSSGCRAARHRRVCVAI